MAYAAALLSNDSQNVLNALLLCQGRRNLTFAALYSKLPSSALSLPPHHARLLAERGWHPYPTWMRHKLINSPGDLDNTAAATRVRGGVQSNSKPR